MNRLSSSLIGLSALFLLGTVSCAKFNEITGKDPTMESIPTKTISGTLMHKKTDPLTNTIIMVPWDLGEATIKCTYSVTEPIAYANISSNGSFTLNLPDTLSKDLFFSPKLDVQITPSPSTLKKTIVPLVVVVEYKENGVAVNGTIKINSFTDGTFKNIKTYYSIYCFDSEGKVVGTNALSGDSFNLEAVKGWNFMQWDNTTGKYQYSLTTSLPTDVYVYM